MRSIVATEANWNALLHHFAAGPDEQMAFGFCGLSWTDEGFELLVREIDLPADEEYRRQGRFGISLKAEHVVPRVLKARNEAALLDMHSHPFTSHPAPSGTDDAGAMTQLRVLHDLAPDVMLVRMVFGAGGTVWAEAAVPPTDDWVPIDRIVVFGPARGDVVYPVNSTAALTAVLGPQDVRTGAVLGSDTVTVVRNKRVLVIGGGGTGSGVLAQLRGYVNHIDIVDPDVVETHNAPRLYHYTAGDEGLPKVDMHRREIVRAFPDCHVQVLRTAFPDDASLALFKVADVIFCCPDHNAVRYAAATAGARYMKPVIEVGCGGKRSGEQVVALGYHVRLQIPGQACLACNGLDLTQLEDPESAAMKRRAGYIEGRDLVAGELMPLTTRAAADAVDLFFRYVTGYTGSNVPRHLYFDALRLQALDLTDAYEPNPACTLCGSGETRISGMGDTLAADQQLLRPDVVDAHNQEEWAMPG
jgi:molybdopterin/thiamine biosynthesis adenylyltransferase